MSTSAEHTAPLNTPVERRFYPRIAPSTLIYISVGQDNEGMLLNVSENGLLVSTPLGLNCNFVSRVSIRLNSLPKAIQVHVRVVWTSESQKRAGMQLIDLSEHDREQVRKWGALESSRQTEREQLPAVTEPSKSPNSVAAMSSRGQTSGSVGAVSAAVSDRAASDRTASSADVRSGDAQQKQQFQVRQAVGKRRAKASASALTASMWVAVPIVIALGIVLLLRSGALHNPLMRSVEDRKEGTGPTTAIGTEMPRLKDPNMPIPTQKAAKASGDDRPSSTRSNTSPENALSDFPVAENHPIQKISSDEDVLAKTNPAPSPNGTAPTTVTQESARSNTTDSRVNQLSMNSVIPQAVVPDLTGSRTIDDHPDTRDAASGALSNEESPNKSATNDSAPNPTHPNDLSISKPSENAPNPIVASTRAPSSRNSDASVVQMDAPGSPVMEIRPPNRHRASFFNLPGERVLESPSVTIHIQRSVRMPAGHLWWPFNRNKKVVVGELVSRIDPQASQTQIHSGGSVRVKATVAEDGHVESVEPINGPVSLVPAVVRAVREWRYQPTLMDDKPVETQCFVMVQFHAPGARAARQ